MSAGQEVGPLDREGRSLIQPPLPPDEATRALAAAAGVSTVGLRPSFVTPAAAHSHPDCRAILILIVAPQAQLFDVHPNQVTQWRSQVLEGAAGLFGADRGETKAAPSVDLKALHAKIGELTLENDFLEGALTKAGLLSARR